MTDWQAIALAVVAVLSLAVQGLVKTLDALAKRKRTIPPPPIMPVPAAREPFPSTNADQSGSYGRPAMADDLPANFKSRFNRMGQLCEDINRKVDDLQHRLDKR